MQIVSSCCYCGNKQNINEKQIEEKIIKCEYCKGLYKVGDTAIVVGKRIKY